MKVFELMAELSKMPAGAEVEFSTIMTIPELISNGVADSDGNNVYYEVRAEIVEVEECDHANKVFLYR